MLRYFNLITSIRNWPVYLAQKFRRSGGKGRVDLGLTTRGKGIAFVVPGAARGVFKEIFLDDLYGMRALLGCLPRNAVIVDAGANVGLFSVAAAEFADHPEIIAVEPLPANVEVLRKNLAAIARDTVAVHCHAAALSGREQASVMLHFSSDATPSVVASTLPGFSRTNVMSLAVPAVTLCALLDEHRIDQVHLLKMDCEGAEFEILNEAPHEVLERIHRIVMEVHESGAAGHSLQQIEGLLRGQGFRLRSRRVDEGVYLVWAAR